jgi:nucleoside 2-deoxyribosyltransferase
LRIDDLIEYDDGDLEGDFAVSYLENKRCYLSGPIENDSGPNWRVEPKKVLTEEFKLDLFDPNEDPKQQWAKPLKKARDECDYKKMAKIAKQFVHKDLTIVDRMDLVIAYLPYKVATTGTHHEIINSSDRKKPTLLICEQGKNMVPLWYYGFVPHQHMFGSWEDLYGYLREVNEGKHKGNAKHQRRWAYIYGLL